MSLPNSIINSTPVGSDAPSTLDNKIRALATAVEDILGIPDATTITTAALSVAAGGLQTIKLQDTAANPATNGFLQRNGAKLVYHDGTAAGVVNFPQGTRLVFHQTSAPTGWTKDTTASLNDNALRVVTGSASSGGTVAFSTVMGTARTTTSVAPGSTDGYTLQVADIPAHSHGVTDPTHVHTFHVAADLSFGTTGAIGESNYTADNSTNAAATGISINNTGGGGSHSHTHSATHAHTSNLNVFYQDVIIASRD